MRRFKKIIVLGTVIATFVASSIGVSAASLRDVFNAEYYASANPDVQAVYGNDVDALFNHYLQHGLKEGRKANPLFDVAKYRETYVDLDAAFGDNWDAYVNHYFTFGVQENRTAGAIFDPLAYAEAYPDIKAAFGDNVQAIINHYLTFGIKEGRTAGVTPTDANGNPILASSSSGKSSGGGSGSSSSSSSSSGGSSSSGSENQTPETPVVPETPVTPETPVVHEHEFTYAPGEAGYHTVTCTAEGCDGGFEESEACNEEADGACSKCEYKAEVEEHEHAFTYAPGEAGYHTVTCTAEGCDGGFEESEACNEEADGACSKCEYEAETP